MPLIVIETNQDLETINTSSTHLMRAASKLVSEFLGKPEDYVMVGMRENSNMMFAGKQHPLAYVELKSLGLPEDQTDTLSKAICELLNKELKIAVDRIYIEFTNGIRHLWGWNKTTF